MYILNTTTTFQITTPANTYIYDIVPVASHITSIASDDSLRIHNPLQLNAAPLSEVKNVNKDVTCLRALGDSGNGEVVIVTAGRDGVVNLVDARRGVVVGKVATDQNAPVLSLACSGPYGLAAGTELTNHQATVSLWDIRNLSTPAVSYIESHSDDITELQFHPTHPHLLLSGSTDGLVNIYNTQITDEEEALHQTINHGSSIHHANFLSETDIFALSHDEKFAMYELVTNPEEGVEEPLPVQFGDLRGVLGGEYVVDVVGRGDGGAVLGLGTHSREAFELVQFKNNRPWAFGEGDRVSLPGAHGSEIVRAFCFLDEHQMVLTAGEDGKINAWRGD